MERNGKGPGDREEREVPTVVERRDQTFPIDPIEPDEALAMSLARYQIGELIGRGGMGEVVLGARRADRPRVAIKRMRATNPPPRSRSRGSCARRGSRAASITRRSCRCTSSARRRAAGRSSR